MELLLRARDIEQGAEGLRAELRCLVDRGRRSGFENRFAVGPATRGPAAVQPVWSNAPGGRVMSPGPFHRSPVISIISLYTIDGCGQTEAGAIRA